MIKKTHLISAVGAVAGASFALGTFAADAGDNPFEAEDLDTGILSAQANFGDEGSCGEGSCGEDDDDDDDEGEGSCGEDDDEGEGSCGEGSCGSS